MSMYCDAITPDGREIHFDDVIKTGDVVEDRERGGHYLVGLDRGHRLPLLHSIDADEWNAYCAELNRKRDEWMRKVERDSLAAARLSSSEGSDDGPA